MPANITAPLLQWTDDDASNTLIAEDPLALLIGFCLDQQITVEKAFAGPRVITERLGTLHAATLARMDPATVEQAFATPPAVHRFPTSMARRVQGLCGVIADEYGGDAASIWNTARDAVDLKRRIGNLPGFGEMKSTTVFAVLVKQFGVSPAGADALLPTWPTLADVNTAGERRAYQAQKRAWKAEMRARAEETPPSPAGEGNTAPSPASSKATMARRR